jgi:peptidoglycan hydrolase FlgJ
MTTPLKGADAGVYGDFSGLEKLKAGARTDDPNAVRQVAKQFESLFARMLIKSMRDAVGKDPIFGSDQAQTYQGMFDDQLSLELTKGKGLGLADMLMRQLQRTGTAAAPGSRSVPAAAQPRASTAAGTTTSRLPAATSTEQVNFVRDVWQQAQQAGQQLGVDPVNVVAQAALETNWGRSVPHDGGGQSSNNLFGIKAGSSWGGAAAASRTQEFANGAAATVTDNFRCYADNTQGFEDYVALLRGNPRFSGALNSGSDVHAFASALQRGGYATDPDYARKVTAVAGQVAAVVGHSTAGSQDSLKFADALPITARTGAL